jgi:hypothetical protein
MIRPSEKLYKILEETFESKSDQIPRWTTDFAEWHGPLSELGVQAIVTNSGDGSHFLIRHVMELMEKGNPELQPDVQYVACPDPMNRRSYKFFHMLFFPKDLAEKIVILGYIPFSK